MGRCLRRDPRKKLQREYERLLEEARDLQRNGDIIGFADVTARAEDISRGIDQIDDGR